MPYCWTSLKWFYSQNDTFLSVRNIFNSLHPEVFWEDILWMWIYILFDITDQHYSITGLFRASINGNKTKQKSPFYISNIVAAADSVTWEATLSTPFGQHSTSEWRHNEHDGVSNHRCLYCCSIVCSGADQRDFKAPRHWLLWGELTVDLWLLRTKA